MDSGVDPDLAPITPKVSAIGVEPSVWAVAALAAEGFWATVQTAELLAPTEI